MLCQMCLEAEATIHVLDRLSYGPPVEADYCPKCYHLKYVNPPARRPAFPRPRFTIKNLMVFAGLFAIPNAAVTLIMRSSLITGTPAQIREWTLQTFLFVSIYCGVMAALVLSLNWLLKVQWYNMTGGLVPMAQPRKLTSRDYLTLPFLILWIVFWFVGGIFLIHWLTSILWPGRRVGPVVPTLIVTTPLLVWAGLRLKSNRDVIDRVRGLWRGASRRERLLRILALSWSFVSLMVMFSAGWMHWFSNPMTSVCALALIVLGGQFLFSSAAVASTRRR